MQLKNYTSSVPVETTIARIEGYLIATGLITGIGKEYVGNKVKSLVFQILYQKDKLPLAVKLSANVDRCQDYFWRDYVAGKVNKTRKTRDDFYDQAARTAWRLQEDWVRVETSLILLNQRTVLQSFMSCVWDGEQTFYQKLEGSGFKQLAAPKP